MSNPNQEKPDGKASLSPDAFTIKTIITALPWFFQNDLTASDLLARIKPGADVDVYRAIEELTAVNFLCRLEDGDDGELRWRVAQ